MNYHVIHDNQDEDLITRLLKVRWIDDNIDSFLNPTFAGYRNNPFLLNDMEKSVERIILAMKNKEKIMIFWDYDVDGITSSYSLYQCFKKFLNYTNVSIQYPDRIQDWYGIKTHHIDQIKEKWVHIIITVDNGISSVKEAEYAQKIGIDLIITDHHHPGAEIPKAFAVINPLVSPNYPFKWLAGVWVTFKLICALTERSTLTTEIKKKIFNYFLPVVAIGTVADVVPLVNENRVIVKKWLDLINKNHEHIPSSLKWFLKYLNIKKNVDTFHIGFVIGPRINAGGRIESPYDSLNILLHSGEKQIEYLDKIEWINTERRKMQEEAFKKAESMVILDDKMIIAADKDFHEGIVGIVAGRLAEKYTKPAAVFKIDEIKKTAVASLRWPAYFNIIEMISHSADILERFWGHKCAWWLAVKEENLPILIERFKAYCKENIKEENMIKIIKVDTKLYAHEWNHETLQHIEKLAPFGEGNTEPVFSIENISIQKIEKVGNNGKSHLKIHGKIGNQIITSMFRGKWGDSDDLLDVKYQEWVSLIGKVKRDTYNWWYFLDIIAIQ